METEWKCEQCGAGPFKSERALWGHIGVRHVKRPGPPIAHGTRRGYLRCVKRGASCAACKAANKVYFQEYRLKKKNNKGVLRNGRGEVIMDLRKPWGSPNR